MEISARNECISSVLPHQPSSVPPSISLILDWQTAIQFDQLINTRVARQLERYDVESCGESLFVHELFLVRSPGVCTPLLLVCKPEFLINSSDCLGSASISIRSGAFPNGGTTQRITVQKSYFTHVKELWSRSQCCNMCHEQMFTQVLLSFRDLSPCRKCREIISVSEYTNVLDRMFVQTWIEHTNVVVQLLHRPFTV